MLLNEKQELKSQYIIILVVFFNFICITFYNLFIHPGSAVRLQSPMDTILMSVLPSIFIACFEIGLIGFGHLWLRRAIQESSYRWAVIFIGMFILAWWMLIMQGKGIRTALWRLLDSQDKFFWGGTVSLFLCLISIILLEIAFFKPIHTELEAPEQHFIDTKSH